jgi:energy-coupling factor transporter ATP-binding protein EcfA2
MRAVRSKCEDSVKNYGPMAVVDRVDLSVEQGDVYGFLGPNGAGRTTTMRMMLGLIGRDAGSLRMFGRDPAEDPVRALDGVAGIIEEPRLYPYLSGRDRSGGLVGGSQVGAGDPGDPAVGVADSAEPFAVVADPYVEDPAAVPLGALDLLRGFHPAYRRGRSGAVGVVLDVEVGGCRVGLLFGEVGGPPPADGAVPDAEASGSVVRRSYGEAP